MGNVLIPFQNDVSSPLAIEKDFKTLEYADMKSKDEKKYTKNKKQGIKLIFSPKLVLTEFSPTSFGLALPVCLHRWFIFFIYSKPYENPCKSSELVHSVS
jgi:hypothetical protein